jgi:hypothetical protein
MRATPMMKAPKRFCVIFSIWGHRTNNSTSFFDTLEEVKEETKLIKEFYKDTPRPIKKSGQYKVSSVDYSKGGCFWGYIVLDYEKKEVLEIYKDGARIYETKIINLKEQLIPIHETRVNYLKDLMFRGEDEVPKNYRWDEGEYEGWIKYRWGDGSNAIKPKELKPKTSGRKSRAEAEEFDPQTKYDKEIEQEWKERKLDRW